MGKPISLQDLPDLPEGLSIESLESPQAKAPERKPASSAAKEYKPSQYVLDKLDKLPKADIKRTIGLDIDYLKGHCTRYGTLEALAAGEFTPTPVAIFTRNVKSYATVRIFPVEREPKWDCEIHNAAQKYALNEKGQPYKGENGKYAVEWDRNPLKEGDILSFNNEPLLPEEMDRLRLTGHLGEPKRIMKSNGEEASFLLSVDPYNNHELCAVSSKVVSMRLKPVIWTKDESGQSVVLRSNGCVRQSGSKEVFADISITDTKGQPLKSAVTGKSNILLPVGKPAIVKVAAGEGREEANVNLSSAQVTRLSPSITYFANNRERVVSYLNARQIGELSLGRAVWAGGEKEGMSFVMSGEKGSLSYAPVQDKGYAKTIQYNAATGKTEVASNYDYVKGLEIEKKNKEAEARAMARSEKKGSDLQVGSHV